MFAPRAAGVILLLYGLFHAGLAAAAGEIAWLLSAVLLGVAATALLAGRTWSRVVVYAAALAAAATGLLSQLHAASRADVDLALASVIWCLWTSLWLAIAYVGARYLPDPEDGAGMILAPWRLVTARSDPAAG